METNNEHADWSAQPIRPFDIIFWFLFWFLFGHSVAEASQVKNELFLATRLIIKPDPQGQIQGQFSSDLQPVFNLRPWLVIRTFILRFCRTWTSQKCQVIKIRSRWDNIFSVWRPVIAFLYCFPFHSFLHCYNTRPLVGVEPHRPPMTNVGTETAFRLDHCKHFQKSKHLLGQLMQSSACTDPKRSILRGQSSCHYTGGFWSWLPSWLSLIW